MCECSHGKAGANASVRLRALKLSRYLMGRAAKAYNDVVERKVDKIMATGGTDTVDLQVRRKAKRDRVVNAIDRHVLLLSSSCSL